VYFADPNAVLIQIVEHGNAALACMWMAVELKYKPKFKFSDEVNISSEIKSIGSSISLRIHNYLLNGAIVTNSHKNIIQVPSILTDAC